MFQDGSGRSLKTLVLEMHSQAHAMQHCQPRMTKHPRKTTLHRRTGKNPSRYLTPRHRIKGCIHQAQEQGFPPAPSFPAPRSHQNGLKQFKQGTKGNQANCNSRNRINSLQPERFHVLFHFLFKVLFIFPSRYLFAIGLAQIFSFGWTLPPG